MRHKSNIDVNCILREFGRRSSREAGVFWRITYVVGRTEDRQGPGGAAKTVCGLLSVLIRM